MAKRKNQHYVPKYLLRGWTDDEMVAVYNLKNEEEYPRTNISHLCSEDYIYGGPEAEESLDGLESIHARIIRDLRKYRSFDVLDEIEILHFCAFVLLQRNRTKQRKREAEEMTDNLMKEYLRAQVEMGELDPELPSGRNALDALDNVRITQENPLTLPMFHALAGIDLIIDLEVVVLENTSETKFIVSDHPVVLDNRLFKGRVKRSPIGLQNRGLQMFVPISENVLMMLYDEVSYNVEYSDVKKRRVVTDSKKVVNGLNDLQIINALESVFYRYTGRKQEFKDAQNRLTEYVNQETTTFQKLSPEEHDFDSENEMLEFGQNLAEYSPYLPFVRQRIEAEFVSRRHPELSEGWENYVDAILEDARKEAEEDC
ncbi:DUF4238 domain-containing protein [Halopelagius fulvigenes]|uniref:DUF4238 domain-containing protein n=1 Tax=Halopelagius fulvigenes TaxID=1198324 RepID=A0ABD5U605_9EURY